MKESVFFFEEDEGVSFMMERIRQKKVVLILDDALRLPD